MTFYLKTKTAFGAQIIWIDHSDRTFRIVNDLINLQIKIPQQTK